MIRLQLAFPFRAPVPIFFPAGAILLLVLLLQSGCATTAQTAAPPAPGYTLAERRLLEIHRRQVTLFQSEAESGGYGSDSFAMRAAQIVADYEAYLSDHPSDVTARVLFGKFLVGIRQPEAAIRQFLHADRLDPTLAVVKQQIGNYLAESGRYMAALPYFLNATDLAPGEAVYFHQLGELLYRFRDPYLEDGFYDRPGLDAEMQAAFRRAAELAPRQREFRMRYAESYYDLDPPDWTGGLDAWTALLPLMESPLDVQTVQLHRARCLIGLGQNTSAQRLIAAVDRPELQDIRNRLLAEIDASP